MQTELTIQQEAVQDLLYVNNKVTIIASFKVDRRLTTEEILGKTIAELQIELNNHLIRTKQYEKSTSKG